MIIHIFNIYIFIYFFYLFIYLFYFYYYYIQNGQNCHTVTDLMAISKRTIIRLIFQGSWGSNFFPDGGVQSLIPKETYIELVIFQGGSRPSGSEGGPDPLDPHMYVQ